MQKERYCLLSGYNICTRSLGIVTKFSHKYDNTQSTKTTTLYSYLMLAQIRYKGLTSLFLWTVDTHTVRHVKGEARLIVFKSCHWRGTRKKNRFYIIGNLISQQVDAIIETASSRCRISTRHYRNTNWLLLSECFKGATRFSRLAAARIRLVMHSAVIKHSLNSSVLLHYEMIHSHAVWQRCKNCRHLLP